MPKVLMNTSIICDAFSEKAFSESFRRITFNFHYFLAGFLVCKLGLVAEILMNRK